eukprot:GSChrysophyteH1.ASY1.ANO1.3256.1 assembled CDS
MAMKPNKKKQKPSKTPKIGIAIDDARSGSASWGKSLYEREREGLPIKRADGKVMRQIIRDVVADDGGSVSGDDDERGEFEVDPQSSEKVSSHTSSSKYEDADEDENGFEFHADFSEDADIRGDSSVDEEGDREEEAKPKKARKEHKVKRERKKMKLALGDSSDDSEDEGANEAVLRSNGEVAADKAEERSNPTATKHKYLRALSRLPTERILQYVGSICRGVLDSPELALKRRAPGKESPLLSPSAGSSGGIEDYKLLDLFDMLTAKEDGKSIFCAKVLEMAMLSMLLIFKDIVPSRRIRPTDSSQQDIKLKKETKALRDFELALLGAYQRYLKLLETYTSEGLGAIAGKARSTQRQSHDPATADSMESKLGLSALRCQCELLVNLPHFNFRQKLLEAVVKRATQRDKKIGDLARESLCLLFSKDKLGDATLECVKLMATTATESKFKNISEDFIRCLFDLKLEVRADEARSLKMKAKKERRKRKRAEDDIATQMAENTVAMEKVTVQKLQANTLHEVSLVYFRIIKGKVGYDLLPVALEGLGLISHLLNLETMEELVELMRGLVERKEGGSALPSPPIQLQCISCALKVLSGPGDSLKIESSFFAGRLAALIYELPASFSRWDIVLECIGLCFGARKKEDRSTPVQSFIKILLQICGHQQASTGCVTVLATAHSMLLQHPRLRSLFINASSQGGKKKKALFEEDDEVGDLAMMALRPGVDASTANVMDSTTSPTDNGSWMLSLLLQHGDPMVRHVIKSFVSKDINPLPVRTADAHFEPMSLVRRSDAVLDGMSKMLDQAHARRTKAQSRNHKMAEEKALHRRQEAYKEEAERRWKSAKHVLDTPDATAALRSMFRSTRTE